MSPQLSTEERGFHEPLGGESLLTKKRFWTELLKELVCETWKRKE